MNKIKKDDSESWQPEPRWHALIAVAAVGGLYMALPSDLIVEPRWLFPAIVFALLTLINFRDKKPH